MNTLDKIIAYINPTVGLKRARASTAMLALNSFSAERKYDAVSMNSRNTFAYLANGNAVQESGSAHKKLSIIGTDLVQNNPLALRAMSVWSNNAIGRGVKAEVHTSDEKGAKRALELQVAFDLFCKSQDCGISGHASFYKIQREIMSEMVTNGGIFIAKIVTKSGLQLQLIEQDRLSSADYASQRHHTTTNGVEMDENGQVYGYWFDPPRHVDTFSITPTFLPVSDVYHVFDSNRANQHIGTSWFAPVALTLDRYATLMEAKIMQQQVSACFSLIVEEPDSGIGIGNSDRVEELEPALITYVKNGSVPHVITPPSADGGKEFEKSIKSDVAVGMGLTYEMLTGDFSNTNFASGRMSRSEFAQGLLALQSTVLEPAFNQVFNWFAEIHAVRKGKSTFTVDWAFPAIEAVNPKEEHDLLMSKVRHGMLSPSKACKLGGENFDTVIEQWNKDKDKIGDLVFDIDPSKYARTGNQLNSDDAGSSNRDDSDNNNDGGDNAKESKKDSEVDKDAK